jgi:hypothetical protein
LLLVISGCDTARNSAEPPPPPQAATLRAASSTASDAATAGAAIVAPDASVEPSLEGFWEAHYEAKKANVFLPAKVKDKGFEADDGKVASGPGSVEIVISSTGAVRGKVTGALGAGVLLGRAEDGALRTQLNPVDPRAPNAMTGTVVGLVKGDVILGKIAVAGPDATVVREAGIELRRQKK